MRENKKTMYAAIAPTTINPYSFYSVFMKEIISYWPTSPCTGKMRHRDVAKLLCVPFSAVLCQWTHNVSHVEKLMTNLLVKR